MLQIIQSSTTGSTTVSVTTPLPGRKPNIFRSAIQSCRVEHINIVRAATFPYPPPPRHEGTPTADVHTVQTSSAIPDSEERAPCGCPLRTAAPDPPQIPAGATEADIEKLKELLITHYEASTFNTCSHQPLPLMHGPPLEFALRPNVVPKAVYTPSVVPRHREDKIRRNLDRDIAMGVLEKVDVNGPVTWCSRTVVTRKQW